MLMDFLSDHSSEEKVARITVEPEKVYFEESRDSLDLNFDFVIKGLTEKNLLIKFIKVAIYDESTTLITFKHLNHNGIGTPSIYTIGKYNLEGDEVIDVINPFFSFPKNMKISYLRYMFTFLDQDTGEEYYYGNIIVKPEFYKQQVKLSLPLKGKLVILDGHDFYSHHRRFAMSIVREVTEGKFTSNFSRYSIDFSIIGDNGKLREMKESDKEKNYDFHFVDAKRFYTDEAPLYSPSEGEIIDIVDDLEDLYTTQFDMGKAIEENRIKEIAGNYIIIKHNEKEYSHLYHLLKGSCRVKVGEKVSTGQEIAKIGFSGSATTYSHLHYQLMDGKDFLNDTPLPFKFSNVNISLGQQEIRYNELVLDTGDIILHY